eukprot:SAG22_NODE_11315_length_490_cov_1.570332_2_plen_44_part_01
MHFNFDNRSKTHGASTQPSPLHIHSPAHTSHSSPLRVVNGVVGC